LSTGEDEISVGLTSKAAGEAPAATRADAADPVAEPRPLRADALRNRARIVEAAESVFAAEGIEVPVDLIAEKAGVGVGTLYRHFPTKEKLCEAILLERLTALTADAQAQANADDPVAAFFGFLEHFVAEGAAKRDLLVAVMGAGVAFDLAATEIKDALRAAVDVLLERAKAAGAVRPEVTAAAVMALVGATCHAAAHDAAPSQELLTIVCDGLRRQGHVG
jgi:AcrR family transcriptional regulator